MNSRYTVECYSDGLWCVVDSVTDKIVDWHEQFGWKVAFADRTEAETAARQMGREKRAVPDR